MMRILTALLLILIIPFTLNAKTFYEYENESINALCKPMIEGGGVHAIDSCGVMMEQHSEKLQEKFVRVYVSG